MLRQGLYCKIIKTIAESGMKRGFFITFEGVEGCGKTTQVSLLKGYLESLGRKVMALREPGGTMLGEAVRPILLNSGEEPIDPWAELFMYEACRAQLVKNVIMPALLNEGAVVICDRFIDSTVAYQGYGRGLDFEDIAGMNFLATGGLVPDLTILLDVDPEAGLKRASARIDSAIGAREDRFEKEALAFHRKVRQGFLELACVYPRFALVDGEREIPSIHKEICGIINGKV